MTQPNQSKPALKPTHKKPRASDARFSTRSILLFIGAVVVMTVVFALVVQYLMAQYRPSSPEPSADDTVVARDLSVEPIDAETLQTLTEAELDQADPNDAADTTDSSDSDDTAPATPEVTDRPEPPAQPDQTPDAPSTRSSSTRLTAPAPTTDQPTPPIIREPAPLPGFDPVMQSDPEDEKVAAIIDQVRRINEAKLAPVLSPQPASENTPEPSQSE